MGFELFKIYLKRKKKFKADFQSIVYYNLAKTNIFTLYKKIKTDMKKILNLKVSISLKLLIDIYI